MRNEHRVNTSRRARWRRWCAIAAATAFFAGSVPAWARAAPDALVAPKPEAQPAPGRGNASIGEGKGGPSSENSGQQPSSEGNGTIKAVEDRIIALIVHLWRVDRDKVTPEASFADDLGADSLDLVELVLAMEKEFGVAIPDEEAEKITTVQQAVDCVVKRQK